ncbi:hypothetical protein, partial [Bordetella pertussis]|uniref:hypothetical protein n=1 Tax=Bordetella pertussis TaxID=520 RepID=UPI000A9ECA31
AARRGPPARAARGPGVRAGVVSRRGRDLEATAAPGQDAPRIEQHLRDTASRLLGPPAVYDDWSVPAAPIAGQLPTPEVVRPASALATPTALAWSDTASLPAAAAVANAIFDATGI